MDMLPQLLFNVVTAILFYFAINRGKFTQVFVSGFLVSALATILFIKSINDWGLLLYIVLGTPAAFFVGGLLALLAPSFGANSGKETSATGGMASGVLALVLCYGVALYLDNIPGLFLMAASPAVFGLGCALGMMPRFIKGLDSSARSKFVILFGCGIAAFIIFGLFESGWLTRRSAPPGDAISEIEKHQEQAEKQRSEVEKERDWAEAGYNELSANISAIIGREAPGKTEELTRILAAASQNALCAGNFSKPIAEALNKGRKDQAALILQTVIQPCPASRTVGNTLFDYATDETLDTLHWLLEQGISPEQPVSISSRERLVFSDNEPRLSPTMVPLTHLVIARGDTQALDVLLAAGARLTTRDKYGRTALHIAALAGDIKAMRLALDAGITPDDKEKEQDSTPLHWAAAGIRPEAAALLLASGASVDAATNAGTTPFLEAAKGVNDEATVAALLGMGCSATLVNTDGHTPLHAFFRCKYGCPIGLWRHYPYQNLDRVNYWRPPAPQKDMLETIRLLQAAGANPAAVDERGNGILHYVASRGQSRNSPAIVALLLRAGAGVNSRDKEGRTPLDYTIDQENESLPEMVDVLRKAGGLSGKKMP